MRRHPDDQVRALDGGTRRVGILLIGIPRRPERRVGRGDALAEEVWRSRSRTGIVQIGVAEAVDAQRQRWLVVSHVSMR